MNIPKVGDKGRWHVGSDIYPVTCIKVSKNGHKVTFRQEIFYPDVGHDYYGDQKWRFMENPKGTISTAYWSAKRKRYLVDGFLGVYFEGWCARQDPGF